MKEKKNVWQLFDKAGALFLARRRQSLRRAGGVLCGIIIRIQSIIKQRVFNFNYYEKNKMLNDSIL